MSTCQCGFTELLNSLAKKIPNLDLQLICLNRSIRKVSLDATYCFNDCLRQHDLNETLWFALMAIYASPDYAMLPSELSQILNLTRTSATRLSDEMVEKGLLIRYQHSSDRRKVMLKLSSEGEQLIHTVLPHTNQLRSDLWQHFCAEELTQLQQSLDKLNEQLERMMPIAKPPQER